MTILHYLATIWKTQCQIAIAAHVKNRVNKKAYNEFIYRLFYFRYTIVDQAEEIRCIEGFPQSLHG